MSQTQKPGTRANTSPTPAKNFKCINCNRPAFKSIGALEQHRNSVHVPAQCQVCKRKFGDIKALNQHTSMHQHCSIKSQHKMKEPALSKASPATSEAASAVSKTSPHVSRASPATSKGTPAVTPAAQPLSPSQPILSVIEGISFPVDRIDALPSLPPVAPGIIHNGHTLTILHPLEQQLMLKYLNARCHSLERLRKQGYLIPTAVKMTGNPYPYKSSVERRDFRESPLNISVSGRPLQTKRQAVVIDCEMVQVTRGKRELAFISAVDFLTGEVLMSNYVQPQAKVTNWGTEISGVTASAVDVAISSGQAFRGWEKARQALWEHISRDTILIGHSLNCDLSVLGIYHSKVFDSAVFTAEAVFPDFIRPTQGLKRLWSLKALARDFLNGFDIQNNSNGHDCLEDTMATREVVLFCLANPELLKVWAEGARRQYDDEQKMKNNKGKKPVRSIRCTFSPDLTESDMDDETEVLRWEDIAEDCGWPHPDTGYDPWSD